MASEPTTAPTPTAPATETPAIVLTPNAQFIAYGMGRERTRILEELNELSLKTAKHYREEGLPEFKDLQRDPIVDFIMGRIAAGVHVRNELRVPVTLNGQPAFVEMTEKERRA